MGRIGIAAVWLFTFGRVRLRPAQRKEDYLLSIGCGFFSALVFGAMFEYAFKSE